MKTLTTDSDQKTDWDGENRGAMTQINPQKIWSSALREPTEEYLSSVSERLRVESSNEMKTVTESKSSTEIMTPKNSPHEPIENRCQHQVTISDQDYL